jgi:multiple sugar transport system permease protein
MQSLTKKDLAIFLLPAVAVMLLITVYPFVYSLILSFQEWNLSGFHGRRFVGLSNYISFFTDPDIGRSIVVTAIYVASCLVTEFIVGLGLAFIFDVKFKGEAFVRGLLLLPMVMSEVVVGLIWRWNFNAEFGIVNYGLSLFGVRPVAWLTTPGVALVSIIIADVWQWTPLIFLVCLAGLKSVPADSIEAARLDGASWWQTQWHVALPTMKPIILSVLLLRMIDCLRFADKIFIMTFGGPAGGTSVLSFQMYLRGFKYFQMGQTAAYSIIYLVIITVLAKIMIGSLRAQGDEAR